MNFVQCQIIIRLTCFKLQQQVRCPKIVSLPIEVNAFALPCNGRISKEQLFPWKATNIGKQLYHSGVSPSRSQEHFEPFFFLNIFTYFFLEKPLLSCKGFTACLLQQNDKGVKQHLKE